MVQVLELLPKPPAFPPLGPELRTQLVQGRRIGQSRGLSQGGKGTGLGRRLLPSPPLRSHGPDKVLQGSGVTEGGRSLDPSTKIGRLATGKSLALPEQGVHLFGAPGDRSSPRRSGLGLGQYGAGEPTNPVAAVAGLHWASAERPQARNGRPSCRALNGGRLENRARVIRRPSDFAPHCAAYSGAALRMDFGMPAGCDICCRGQGTILGVLRTLPPWPVRRGMVLP